MNFSSILAQIDIIISMELSYGDTNDKGIDIVIPKLIETLRKRYNYPMFSKIEIIEMLKESKSGKVNLENLLEHIIKEWTDD